jgi:iron-sulfur cluster assembly protein
VVDAADELDFDNKKDDADKVFEDNNVRIIVDKKSVLYLVGTVLEYSGGLNGKGFVFNNPNAQRTCGCGESFSL